MCAMSPKWPHRLMSRQECGGASVHKLYGSAPFGGGCGSASLAEFCTSEVPGRVLRLRFSLCSRTFLRIGYGHGEEGAKGESLPTDGRKTAYEALYTQDRSLTESQHYPPPRNVDRALACRYPWGSSKEAWSVLRALRSRCWPLSGRLKPSSRPGGACQHQDFRLHLLNVWLKFTTCERVAAIGMADFRSPPQR